MLLLPDIDPPAREAKTFTTRLAEFRQGLAEVFRTPPIFVAAGIEAVMYLGYGAFLGFLPIYAKNVGLNDAEIATVLGVQLLLAMVAKPIAGRLSDVVGRIPVIVTGLLLCATALPLVFRAENLTGFLLVTPVLGLQCAYRRSRLGTQPGRRHGCVRDHLGHRRSGGAHDRRLSDRQVGLRGDL